MGMDVGKAFSRAVTVPGWLKGIGKVDAPNLATPASMADARIAAMGASARARLASAGGGMGFGGTVKTAPGGTPTPTTKSTLSGV